MQDRVSLGERKFIEEGIELNIRNDGRTNLDYRHFTIQTGIISQTNGSARIKLGHNTEILVGVKLETTQPNLDTGDEGKVQLAVHSEVVELEITGILEKLVRLNLKDLCILPGKVCWIVYVDVMVLGSGGNLLDAIAIATRAALYNTMVPIVEVDEAVEDFEVTDRFKKLDIQQVPICVTFTKIGNAYVVDASTHEEICRTVQLTVAINRDGNICGTQKGGHGGLDPSSMNEMLQAARKLGKQILDKLDVALKQEEQEGGSKSGFFSNV